jgi:mRNA-degrading endonuclease RelE of RelBE toxin-antitoxin system
MNGRRYRIEYGPTALNDLDSLAERIRKQVLHKIARLKFGLHGDIKHLRQADIALQITGG